MEQQQQTTTPTPHRAVARRVPGLEGMSAKMRVQVERGRTQVFAIRDGVIEPMEEGDGPVDAEILFDDDQCVDSLLSGRLNPIVAALRGKLRVSGDIALVAKVLFELQGQAGGFGRRIAGEA